MNANQIYQGDCLKLMQSLPDESVDAIISDPPYTDGNGNDVLGDHKIQTAIDIPKLIEEFYGILKPDSFLCIFGMFPTIITWYNAIIDKGFKYKESITWVKRNSTAVYLPILRQKEEILIFKKGNPEYNKTKGKFEDIKMPAYLDGLLNIESLNRYMGEARYIIRTGETKRYLKNNIANDSAHIRMHNSSRERLPEESNFTNVWSFMPHNKQGYNDDEFNVKHPTVKPIPLMQRLIELLSFENQIILDPFLGSGTTAIAAIRTNRQYIGMELSEEYCDIANKRVEQELSQPKLINTPAQTHSNASPQNQEVLLC